MATLGHPPQARLRAPTDFLALRREGKRITARHFQTQYRLSGQSPTARLGMAVSRRVSKLAVVRNRIRRAIRESFRLHRNGLPPCDILIIASASAAAQTPLVLRGDLDLIWTRLASLKPHEAAGTMPARS